MFVTFVLSLEKKQMKYSEINLEHPSITANGSEKKTVEVGKFYEWSL